MKRKGLLVVAIILMSIGFAAVSTTLVINGNAKVNENTEDYSVIFTAATLDNEDVYNEVISEDKKTITFRSKDLKKLNDTSVLKYEVTNNSSNYDAEVRINCNVKENTEAKYTSISNVLENNVSIVKAKESVNGTLTITLNKTATEEVTEEYTCTITANAKERDAIGASKISIPVYSKDKNGTDLNATSTEITGQEKKELLNKLKETNLVNNIDDVDALIEVDSDDFEDMASTTFDVSEIASTGDEVVILHYDEINQKWEYISKETVGENGTISADFSSYSPVAFVVKKADGTYENAILEPVSFSADSWSTIAANVKSGNTSKYNVGDTKSVDLGNLGTHMVRISNKSACTTETSETACGFVVEFVNTVSQYSYNESITTNVGGWRDSELRTYINDTLYDMLPNDLQENIVVTKVLSGHGKSETENFETEDKLYLFSAKEIYGTNYQYDSIDTETKQLDYYKNLGVTLNYNSGAKKTGVNVSWWLRSARSNSDSAFIRVLNDGTIFYGLVTGGPCGISPAFRIA